MCVYILTDYHTLVGSTYFTYLVAALTPLHSMNQLQMSSQPPHCLSPCKYPTSLITPPLQNITFPSLILTSIFM